MSIVLFLIQACFAGPLTPQEALKTFQLADPNLTIEVVASEPQIEDPVAMAFDEDGRLYVAEMRSFQQGPDYKGIPGMGRIKLLEDRDGDGVFEHSTIFADNMNYPTAVMPAYGGVLVGAAPDILYFKDTDGDGRADVRKVVFTGFGRANHEQLMNSFQWGLDNWIHAASGGAGGDIRPGDHPDAKPVGLGTRNFRFRLSVSPNRDQTGVPLLSSSASDFDLTSGGGQYGLTADDWGDWFTSVNASHIMQIVLPDEYLRRNPSLAVSGVLTNISDHDAAARIYRTSPMEEWRVVRTRQRAATQAARFAPTELVPGGYITAACGNCIYRGDLLPKEYYGDSFVCDASNNLIHRDRLVPNGVTFTAKRTDNEEREFFTSTDNWCRPVTVTYGPDGALYVIDMYREIIETPVSIPPDILKTLNMENGKNEGRIYRIHPKSTRYTPGPTLSHKSANDLVPLLGHPNAWWRMSAQRLLFERQDKSIDPLLQRMARSDKNPLARLHALYTMDGLNLTTASFLAKALQDPDPRVREHVLRLSESTAQEGSNELLLAMLALVNDPSPHVRFQLAFNLGDYPHPETLAALAKLAERDIGDPWMRTAILSSVEISQAADFWLALWANNANVFAKQSDDAAAFTHDLMAMIGTHRSEKPFADTLNTIVKVTGPSDTWWRTAALDGLADGLERAGAGKNIHKQVPLTILKLIADKQAAVRWAARRFATRISWPSLPEFTARIGKDAAVATDEKQELAERLSAIALLGCGNLTQVGKPLERLIGPDQPVDIQKAAVAALAHTGRPIVATTLLARERWMAYTPGVRDVVINAALARKEYLPALLKAIEDGDVPAWAIDTPRRTSLLEHRDTAIRARAAKVLTVPTSAERQAMYNRYKPALKLSGNAARGKDVFKVSCSACHKLEDTGHAVGPDLTVARERDAAALLADIIMPSQALTAGYSYYLIDTEDGESLAGVIASESASAVTLRQREGVERTILRSNIKSLYASSISMMPEDLENNITPQQMADLIAYLKAPK